MTLSHEVVAVLTADVELTEPRATCRVYGFIPPASNFVRRCTVTGLRSRSVGPLLLLSLAALSCGSSRQLQSVKINPATASGQAQFAAMGTFSKPPSPVTLTGKDVKWCVGELTSAPNATPNTCIGNVAPFATVDQNGSAQCSPTSHGTTGYILAGADEVFSMNPDGGSQFKVSGAAT